MADLLTFTHPSLLVLPWKEPPVSTPHDPRGEYAELFWLPSLGPSAMWLLRRLALHFQKEPNGFEIDLRELAFQIGLGNGTARHSPFRKVFERLVVFDLAKMEAGNLMRICENLPTISQRQFFRLPASLQDLHTKWNQPLEERASITEMRSRAFHLAMSMQSTGMTDAEMTEQMMKWHFHPSVVHEAISKAAAIKQEEPVA